MFVPLAPFFRFRGALLLLCCIVSIKQSQAQRTPPDDIAYFFEVVGKSKAAYSIGDTVHLSLTAIQSGRICADGVERTRLLGKGIQVIHQQAWRESPKGRYSKQFAVVVTGNKSMSLQITAYRKTDKGEISKTLSLKSIAKP